MAVTALKTWIAGEVLTASDLNSEFSNIYSGGESLGWPATTEKDLNGQEFWLDSDKDSSLHVSTDDLLNVKLQGQDLFNFDGTTASSVNGLDFTAAAAGSPATVSIDAQGSSTDIDINLVPKGAGNAEVGGTRILVLGDEETAQTILSTQVFG